MYNYTQVHVSEYTTCILSFLCVKAQNETKTECLKFGEDNLGRRNKLVARTSRQHPPKLEYSH